MSITFGIYDFFSYLIPGLLYLFAFEEFLRSIGRSDIKISDLLEASEVQIILFLIPVLVGAYVIGHILDPIAQKVFYKFLDRFRYPRKKEGPKDIFADCLQKTKEKTSNLEIDFKKEEWGLLFSLIRQRNIEMAHILDKLNADSIMLNNVAFGMFILAISQLIMFFTSQNSIYLQNTLGAIILCMLAFSRSNQFRKWFIMGIFDSSLEYGSNLKQVIEYSRQNSMKELITIKDKKAKKTKKKKDKSD